MNEVVSLISFLACLPLVYREATDLCLLILCPTTVLNVFISSRDSSVGVSRVSYYRILSSAIRTIILFVVIFYPFLVSFLQLQLQLYAEWKVNIPILLLILVFFSINKILVIESNVSFITLNSSVADCFRTLVMKAH